MARLQLRLALDQHRSDPGLRPVLASVGRPMAGVASGVVLPLKQVQGRLRHWRKAGRINRARPLGHLRPGGVLVVTKLDRLARSAEH